MNCKRQIFPWIRLNRVIRDIPSQNIIGGNSNVSLRQIIMAKLKAEGKSCQCMRCREVKNQDLSKFKPEKILMRVRE